MKTNRLFALQIFALISAAVLGLFCFTDITPQVAQAADSRPNSTARTGTGVIVQDRFGGQILGFDVDQASDEGVLTEYQTLDNGNVLAAVETFSQTTGQILRVIVRTQRRDDFIT